MNTDLIARLRIRAKIRRSIPHRRSVINNEPDRLADLLDEAANALEKDSDREFRTQKIIEYTRAALFFILLIILFRVAYVIA